MRSVVGREALTRVKGVIVEGAQEFRSFGIMLVDYDHNVLLMEASVLRNFKRKPSQILIQRK